LNSVSKANEDVRTVSLFGGMLRKAGQHRLIDNNLTNGIRKPKYALRLRRLSDGEHRTFVCMLRGAERAYPMTINIIRLIAMTGSRRSEVLQSERPDTDGSCLFPGWGYDSAVGGFPNQWDAIFKDTPLDRVTAHVLRHSFASMANNLGCTKMTIVALIGHSKRMMTSKHVCTLYTTPVMAADSRRVAGYINGLLNSEEFHHATYALDHASRKAALDQFFAQATQGTSGQTNEQVVA
jgi:integrase